MHQHFRIAIIRSEIVCFSIKNVKPFILIIHCQWQILIKCSILIMICYTQQKQLVFPMSQKPCCGVFPYNALTESVPKRLVGECFPQAQSDQPTIFMSECGTTQPSISSVSVSVCLLVSAKANSKCGTAQLSLSLFVLFSCSSKYFSFIKLIHLSDLLNDVRFPLWTNQRPN